jgi:Tfp pilus assembly protein PilV
MTFRASQNKMVVNRNYRRSAPRGRRGLSLLEVILSVAILGGSMAVIGNLYHLGYRSGLKAQLLNDANMIAGATMAELVVGAIALESTGDSEVPTSPQWFYSVDIQDSMQPGLFLATVTVRRGVEESALPASISIVRLIPDPEYEPEEDAE